MQFRRFVAALVLGLVSLSAVAHAQTPPKSPVFGIAPGATGTAAPVTINDGNGQSIPIGVINPATHVFTPAGLASEITRAQAAETAAVLGAPLKANNLSDLASPSAARTNLGLGGAAVLYVGAAANTVAAGNDSRIVAAVQAATGTTTGLTAAVSAIVDDTAPGATIPADFINMSFDTCGALVPCSGWLPPGDSFFSAANTPLINAFNTIASTSRIRIGGNPSDYVPAVPLTSTIASNLAAFMASTNSKLIYGLDAKLNSSSTAATQAGLIATAVGVNNVIFQIGNEPELTTTYPPGQTNFASNLSDYIPLWNNYYTAITAAVSGAKFMGPDGTSTNNLPIFLSGVTAAKLTDLSFHLYPLQNGTLSYACSPDNLMQTSYAYGYANFAPPSALKSLTVSVANAAGLGMRMTEGNSAYSGGCHGVSDALVSAAWVIDYGLTLVSQGWNSMHLETCLACLSYGSANYYGAVSQASNGASVIAHPLYYGMMIIGRLEGGRILPVTTNTGGVQGPANVAVYGVLGTDNLTRIALVNRSSTHTANITASRKTTWSTGTVLMLSGSSCTDTTGVTLGGATLSSGGTWTGSTVAITPSSVIALPPCASALVTITG